MSNGEIITKVTIWITIAGYATGTVAFALSRGRRKWDSVARVAWTAACVGLLVHVASAYQFYHQWSHEAAYLDTARQTNEVFGLNWGGGLYVNYAVLICWIMDLAWWWLRGLDSYRQRPWPLIAAWHGFLIFIIFNAAVIFKTGFMRWGGLCVCLGLCFVWWLAIRQNLSGISRMYPLRVAKD